MRTTHMRICTREFVTALYSSVRTKKWIMSLYKYLKKGGPALPTPRTCGDSCLSKKDIEQANREVKRTLDLNQSGKKSCHASRQV